MNTKTPTDLITQSEAADLIGVTKQAITNWIRREKISLYITDTGRHRVSRREVMRAKNQRKNQSKIGATKTGENT